MRIIITGIGEVGFHLAKLLAKEGHDIVLLDCRNERLQYAANHLDVHTIKGNSLSYKALDEAKVAQAHLLISVTGVEETNIATAIIGKNLGAERTIARVSNTEFLDKKDTFSLRSVGIDEIIIPESLAAQEVQHLLRDTAITDSFDFDEGALILAGIALHKNSPFIGKSLNEIWISSTQRRFTNVAILRRNQTLIPNGDTRFERDDHAYFITQPDALEELVSLSGKARVGIKNIIILGGSQVGINTTRNLQKKYEIKIIEQNKDKCYELADMFPDIMVVNGDGRNTDLLEEEGIEHADAFIALTGNSEANIISSLVAKNRGVDKAIALVENIDYIHLSQGIGVDTLINKKLIAANFIFRHIRKGEVLSLTTLHGVDAEVLEFEVKEESKALQRSVKNIGFPAKAVIGGVIRKGVGHTVDGDFHFMSKDRVVVLCSARSVREVEKFFS